MSEDLAQGIVLAADMMKRKEATNTRYATLQYIGPQQRAEGGKKKWWVRGPDLDIEKNSLAGALNILAENGFVADKQDLRALLKHSNGRSEDNFQVLLSKTL